MWGFGRGEPAASGSGSAAPEAIGGILRLQRWLASRITPAAAPGGLFWRAEAGHRWLAYAGGLSLIALITVLGLLLKHRVAATNVALFYLLAVVISALQWGRGPALVSCIAGVLAFDYFLIPPAMSFAISDVSNLITALSMLIVGLLISTFAGEARERAETARRSEESTAAIYAFSQALVSCSNVDGIAESAGRHIVETFTWPALVAVPGEAGLLARFRSPEFPDSAHERAAAEWVFRHEEPAGYGTGTWAQVKGYYLPLRTAWGVRGVLGVVISEADRCVAARRHLLEVFASRTALALGRAVMEEVSRQTEVLRETDKMQKALLNS